MKDWHCNICEMVLYSSRSAWTHYNKEHVQFKYICTICADEFRSKASFDFHWVDARHQRKSQNDDKYFLRRIELVRFTFEYIFFFYLLDYVRFFFHIFRTTQWTEVWENCSLGKSINMNANRIRPRTAEPIDIDTLVILRQRMVTTLSKPIAIHQVFRFMAKRAHPTKNTNWNIRTMNDTIHSKWLSSNLGIRQKAHLHHHIERRQSLAGWQATKSSWNIINFSKTTITIVPSAKVHWLTVNL